MRLEPHAVVLEHDAPDRSGCTAWEQDFTRRRAANLVDAWIQKEEPGQGYVLARVVRFVLRPPGLDFGDVRRILGSAEHDRDGNTGCEERRDDAGRHRRP